MGLRFPDGQNIDVTVFDDVQRGYELRSCQFLRLIIFYEDYHNADCW